MTILEKALAAVREAIYESWWDDEINADDALRCLSESPEFLSCLRADT